VMTGSPPRHVLPDSYDILGLMSSMQPDFDDLVGSLSMTDIIRLQTVLATALVRRFERTLTLVFSDIVGSTPYFAKFGDAAGRQLQQRHVDLLQECIGKVGGRTVDTAGDGAFMCFQSVDDAVSAMVELLGLISIENTSRSRERQLTVRIGVHNGTVLTDGVQVTGDSVNLCARVTGTACPGEIRLTKAAFFALTQTNYRLKCRPLPPAMLKGVDKPAELVLLDWRDRKALPSAVRLDTGKEYALPDQDIITFGRLKEQAGLPANDIVLECGEESMTLQISRWHFELRRRGNGLVIRSVTASPTMVNSHPLLKGEEHPIHPGDHVLVGNVLSIHFLAPPAEPEEVDAGATVMIGTIPGSRQR
jgi:class 3 adenylate cyclase